eukprot:COSAG05_NODE_398_length_10293_cov_11.919176_1_plen_66_part_00
MEHRAVAYPELGDARAQGLGGLARAAACLLCRLQPQLQPAAPPLRMTHPTFRCKARIITAFSPSQ